MAGELTAKEKVVGLKQTRRAVSQGSAKRVYLACDADPALTEPLLTLCRERGVEADCSLTMQHWAVPAASPYRPPPLPSWHHEFPAGINSVCSVENIGKHPRKFSRKEKPNAYF